MTEPARDSRQQATARPAGGRRGTLVPAVALVGLVGLAGCRPRGEAPAPTVLGRAEAAVPPSGASGGFTDVTAAAGIAFEHRLPGEDLLNIVDSLGAGAAFADLDGDDWLDLVVLGGPVSPAAERGERPAGLRVYHNLRDGRFEDWTSRSRLPADATALAIAVADFDGDADRDVYLIDRGPNQLYRNRGDGSFDPVPGAQDDGFGVGAVFFDMDRDGDLDLYLANYLEFDPRLTPFYSPDAFPGPLAYPAQAGVLYRNEGSGSFRDVTAEAGLRGLDGRGMSVLAADLDEDGATDLFVANDASPNFLLHNDGKGRFAEVGLLAGVALGENGDTTAAMAADLGDVDGDGHPDLAVSDTAFGSLYRRTGAGRYSDVILHSGIAPLRGEAPSWGQNLIDFDNDGDLDLFVARGGLHHLTPWQPLLLRNDGAGRFDDAAEEGGEPFSRQSVGRASIVGDYDNDGDLDVFFTSLAGPATLLRNDISGAGSWIKLDLVGRSSRDPFGARVELEAGGRTWSAVSRCPAAYLGQSDPRLHFGLGPGVDRVERARIVWSGGASQELVGLPARRIVRVVEGGP